MNLTLCKPLKQAEWKISILWKASFRNKTTFIVKGPQWAFIFLKKNDWNYSNKLRIINTVLKKAFKEIHLAIILLFNTNNFNRLEMFKDKVIFFITSIIANKGRNVHFNIKLSKTISYTTQSQINVKINFSSAPLKFYPSPKKIQL